MFVKSEALIVVDFSITLIYVIQFEASQLRCYLNRLMNTIGQVQHQSYKKM